MSDGNTGLTDGVDFAGRREGNVGLLGLATHGVSRGCFVTTVNAQLLASVASHHLGDVRRAASPHVADVTVAASRSAVGVIIAADGSAAIA
jgi:hypothetical protein